MPCHVMIQNVRSRRQYPENMWQGSLEDGKEPVKAYDAGMREVACLFSGTIEQNSTVSRRWNRADKLSIREAGR